MTENKTTAMLDFLAPLADGHVPKIMVKAPHLAAIAEKYKRMEEALELVCSFNVPYMNDAMEQTHIAASEALDFDPLS